MKRLTSYLRPTLSSCALLLASGITRANAPAGRYLEPSSGDDAVIFDTKTGLAWYRYVPSTQYSWGSAATAGTAQAYCATLKTIHYAPVGAWRVPTVGELLTLVDYSQAYTGTTALIDPIFPNTPATSYWTSTPGAAGLTGLAWYVDFSKGVSGRFETADPTKSVRCVITSVVVN